MIICGGSQCGGAACAVCGGAGVDGGGVLNEEDGDDDGHLKCSAACHVGS